MKSYSRKVGDKVGSTMFAPPPHTQTHTPMTLISAHSEGTPSLPTDRGGRGDPHPALAHHESPPPSHREGQNEADEGRDNSEEAVCIDQRT